jgi:hypothetical protein
VFDGIVAIEDGDGFGPDHGGAQLGDGFVVAFEQIDHGFQSVAGICQVVDQEHFAGDFAFGGGDEAGDIQMALDGTFAGAIRAGAHDSQRFVEDAGEDVSGAHATACEAQDGVELPAALMNFERELFNEVVILVVADVEVFAVFCEHFLSSGGLVVLRTRDFERRGRGSYAEDAEKKQPNFGFLFCVLCEVFAFSAFKKVHFGFKLNKDA